MDFYNACASNKTYCKLQSKLLHMIRKYAPVERLTNREGTKRNSSMINKKNLKNFKKE